MTFNDADRPDTPARRRDDRQDSGSRSASDGSPARLREGRVEVWQENPLSLASPRRAEDEREVDASYRAELRELLLASDFISLHCPGGEATENLIDATRLSQMKSSAFLINTARGSVVDESGLIAALKDGTIAGAGIDVYRHEPAVHEELLQLENVVLLPVSAPSADFYLPKKASRTSSAYRST